jgi:hypothetical protein
MKFWGVVFLVATSLVAVLKHKQKEKKQYFLNSLLSFHEVLWHCVSGSDKPGGGA